MPVRRPLTTLNHIFYFLSTVVNANNGELIELAGRLDHAILRRALEAAVARHPSLDSRLERGMTGDVRWVTGEDLGPIELRIERHPDLDEAEVRERIVDAIWGEPLDLFRQRPLRAHLIELPRRSILVIVTTHVWADARAVQRVCYDVADCYTALAEGHKPDPVRFEVGERSSEWLFAPAFKAVPARYWLQAVGLLAGELATTARGLKLAGRRGRNDFRKMDLGAPFLDRLCRAARLRGTTVHALIMAAMRRTCLGHDRAHGRLRPRRHQIIDMFSLRPYAREDATHLVDTMVVPFGSRIDTADQDAEVIQATTRALNRWKSGLIFAELFRQRLYALVARPLPKRFATRLMTSFLPRGNVICTNPGPIPYTLERMGPVQVTDFYGYSQLYPPGRVMCIFTTYRGSLRLAVLFDRNAFPEDIEAGFIDPLIGHLHALVDESLHAAEGIQPAAGVVAIGSAV